MELFACGFNGFQQIDLLTSSERRSEGLGGDHPAVTKPVKVLSLKTPTDIVVLACSWSKIYTVFRDNTSSVSAYVSWSNNEELKAVQPCKIACAWSSVLAVDASDKLFLRDEDTSDTNWKESSVDVDTKIEAISGGENSFYLIYDDGKIGELTPRRQPPATAATGAPRLTITAVPLSVAAVSLSCGKEHVLVLTQTGCIYSFGLGSRGQLGHGSVDEEREPRLIEALEGISVTSVAAGGWHSTAVTADGDLYVWGWNEMGQLGLPSAALRPSGLKADCDECKSLVAVPEPVVISGDPIVTKSSCGSRHTAVLTDTNRLFTTGWNKYGQLCLGDVKSRDTFTEVEAFSTFSLQDVHCGYWNTVCVTRIKPLYSHN